MPKSPISDLRLDNPHIAGSISIAVVHPTPVIHGQSSVTNSKATSAGKRPKLSLDTDTATASPFRSKQSTSLRLDSLSAVSPTTRNTYGNAYERPISTGRSARLPERRDSAQADTPIDRAIFVASPLPLSATCEVESTAEIIPYTLGHGTNPILRNGPRESRQRTSSAPKPFFSLTKRVIFRAPLTEEVKNKEYTLRHSDITPVTTPVPVTENENQDTRALALQPSQTGCSENEGLTLKCPATPVAGRDRKDRHWYWTLESERLNTTPPDQEHEALPISARIAGTS